MPPEDAGVSSRRMGEAAGVARLRMGIPQTVPRRACHHSPSIMFLLLPLWTTVVEVGDAAAGLDVAEEALSEVAVVVPPLNSSRLLQLSQLSKRCNE